MKKVLKGCLGVLFLMLICTSTVVGQEFFRIRGDFSIKSKSDSLANLTMGQFLYDKNKKLIIYHITFPKEQVWIFADTSVYRFEGEELLDRTQGMAVHEFSIFHLAANNHLANYGLKNSLYKLVNVEKDAGMVMSTWEPPSMLKEYFGKVIISNKDKRIYGVAFFDKEERIVRKQFFTGYQNFQGLEFPIEIVDIFTMEQGETSYQKTLYKNIKVNEKDNSGFYNFELPAGYQSLLAN